MLTKSPAGMRFNAALPLAVELPSASNRYSGAAVATAAKWSARGERSSNSGSMLVPSTYSRCTCGDADKMRSVTRALGMDPAGDPGLRLITSMSGG